MSKHRDMSRDAIMALARHNLAHSNMTPILTDKVDGDLSASLFTEARLFEGKHVSNYRLEWNIPGNGTCGLKLGDAVSFELVVHMYQGLLALLSLGSSKNYSKERIVPYLLNLDI